MILITQGESPALPERKVLCYCLSFAGGAGKNLVQIQNGLVDAGWEVELCFGKGSGRWVTQLRSTVRVTALNQQRSVGALIPLASVLRDTQPNIVLTTVGANGVVCALALMLAGCDADLVIREANSPSAITRTYPVWTRGLKRLILRLAYRRASAVVAITKAMEEEIRDSWGVDAEKTHTIHNGVALPRTYKRNARRPAPYEVISVGRLTQQKDHETLLRAWALLVDHIDARLTIVGDGEERDHLEAQALHLKVHESVKFVGEVSDPGPFYEQADLVVLSSRYEGCPNVLLEALAWGVPVVSTRCPTGPEEIINRADYGRLVPVGDHIALANAIEQVLQGDFDPETLRSRARDFSVHIQQDRFVTLLGELLSVR